MNLLRATAVGGRVGAGDLRVAVDGSPDGTLVLGIRPEAFHPDEGHGTEPTVDVRVEVVEQLGHEAIVYGSIRGERAVALGADAGLPPLPSERATVIARLSERAQPAVGETVPLAFSIDDLRLFDGSTGEAIGVPGRAAPLASMDPHIGSPRA
jgi:ABC-type sugar transport system ATPase subunit